MSINPVQVLLKLLGRVTSGTENAKPASLRHFDDNSPAVRSHNSGKPQPSLRLRSAIMTLPLPHAAFVCRLMVTFSETYPICLFDLVKFKMDNYFDF